MKIEPDNRPYEARDTRNSDESVDDAMLRGINVGKIPNYEEQKIRSSSVLSSGQ